MIQDMLGFNIVSLRKAKGLSQKELAEKLNYSDKVISKWERGESLPDIIALEAIAKFFGISIDELVRGDTSKNTITTFELPKSVKLIHTKKPSRVLVWSLLPITLLWLATIFGDVMIFLAVGFIYGLFLIVYGILVSYNQWEANFAGHDIVIGNKPTKAVLMIDGVVVDQDNSLLRAGIKLRGKLDNNILNVYLSFVFFVKCEVTII